MDSVSADHTRTEDQLEPMLGVAPARMNWVRTRENGSEIVELYLDRSRRDGCLVRCVGDGAEENVGTLQWSASGLGGVVWRGSVTAQDQENWRIELYRWVEESIKK